MLRMLIPPGREILSQLPGHLGSHHVLGSFSRVKKLAAVKPAVGVIVHGDDIAAVDEPEVLGNTGQFGG